jgi:hypothetical protein
MAGGHSQGFVNPAKVVVHEMQGHSMTVIFNLLGEAICQASETAHSHTHREILAFYKRCADMVRVRIAGDRRGTASNAGSRAVAAFIQAGRHAIYLYEHAVINIAAKGIFHGIHVNAVTVCSELKSV